MCKLSSYKSKKIQYRKKKMKFIGRKKELNALNKLSKRKNTITVIYGRRRIGKSCLIKEFLKNKQSLFFEGLEGLSKAHQLKNFILQLNYQTGNKFKKPKSWSEALLNLNSVVENKAYWIVFDEFQWIANYRSEIVSELKMIWDQYLSKTENISMILCGSIASFMTTKVIKSKALYGRTDLVISLKEFKLYETRIMLKDYGFQELLDAQMILGGVPKYLELVSSYPSLYLALDDLAFSETGYFFEEFERIFVSHFAKNADYLKIINCLSKYPYGLYRDELVNKASIDTGGGLTQHLNNLESAGFIKTIYPIDKQKNSRILKYYISDAFLRFYYAFIKPKIAEIENNQQISFNELTHTPLFYNWRGKAFENLCMKHTTKIANILGFSSVKYKVGPYFRASKQGETGSQIDLLFDRADNVLTMCELKSSKSPIGIEVEKEINQKIDFLQKKYKRHSIQAVLIYDGTITNNLKNSPYILKKISSEQLIIK